MINTRKLRCWLRTKEGKANYPSNPDWIQVYEKWASTPTKNFRRDHYVQPSITKRVDPEPTSTPRSVSQANETLYNATQGEGVIGRWYVYTPEGKRHSGPYRTCHNAYTDSPPGYKVKFVTDNRPEMRAIQYKNPDGQHKVWKPTARVPNGDYSGLKKANT